MVAMGRASDGDGNVGEISDTSTLPIVYKRRFAKVEAPRPLPVAPNEYKSADQAVGVQKKPLLPGAVPVRQLTLERFWGIKPIAKLVDALPCKSSAADEISSPVQLEKDDVAAQTPEQKPLIKRKRVGKPLTVGADGNPDADRVDAKARMAIQMLRGKGKAICKADENLEGESPLLASKALNKKRGRGQPHKEGIKRGKGDAKFHLVKRRKRTGPKHVPVEPCNEHRSSSGMLIEDNMLARIEKETMRQQEDVSSEATESETATQTDADFLHLNSGGLAKGSGCEEDVDDSNGEQIPTDLSIVPDLVMSAKSRREKHAQEKSSDTVKRRRPALKRIKIHQQLQLLDQEKVVKSLWPTSHGSHVPHDASDEVLAKEDVSGSVSGKQETRHFASSDETESDKEEDGSGFKVVARFPSKVLPGLSPGCFSNGTSLTDTHLDTMCVFTPASVTPVKQRSRKAQLENGEAAEVQEPVVSCKMTPRTRKLTDALQKFVTQKENRRQWREVDASNIHPLALIGRSCKIYWPLDDDWYPGVVHDYCPQTKKHRIDYKDNEMEMVLVSEERLQLKLSPEEWAELDTSNSSKGPHPVELVSLVEDEGIFGHGDLVWAKIKGYPMWPAVVMDEDHAAACGIVPGKKGMLPLQFFGSYDHCRFSEKKLVLFSEGLTLKFHTKCKQVAFVRGLEEVERYLNECRLPDIMAHLVDDGDGVHGAIERQRRDIEENWAEPNGDVEAVLPAGYKPIDISWKHLDRCTVCYLDEEYDNNVLLQCDKCRFMVHMHCYGELELPDGGLWLCSLCRLGAPKARPPCCLCPVTSGPMKKTTNGRWAHLMCALWIPETCLVDVQRMEPVDGIHRVAKERWKLTCSICKVPYGACIQCGVHGCRTAFHPLCARSAGLRMEVIEDKQRKGVENNFRLLAYCGKHKQPTTRMSEVTQLTPRAVTNYLLFQPPTLNSSGCARSEPYNAAARRGRREPEALAAALAKRSFVENLPYRVTGCRQYPPVKTADCSDEVSLWSLHWEGVSRGAIGGATLCAPIHSMSGEDIEVLSMSDKFRRMKASVSKRLLFGKSAIHGMGVFTKQAHRANDMVIEYAGEVVRPVIADIRERRCYDSLVGAGTYMFRIDDERVVDATRAGSIAHLINHSCEPNCYSRTVTASGEDRIIIFAKRNIEIGEELTYDYRFTSKDEVLTCYCGCPGCRGSVNLVGENEDPNKLLVPLSNLIKLPATTRGHTH